MTYEEFKEKVGSVILTEQGNCPVTPVVQMLQGKWKLQILYELCIKSPMRFGELKKVLQAHHQYGARPMRSKNWKRTNWCSASNTTRCRCGWSTPSQRRGRTLLPVFYAIVAVGDEIHSIIVKGTETFRPLF